MAYDGREDLRLAEEQTAKLRQQLVELEMELATSHKEETDLKIKHEMQTYELDQLKQLVRDNDEILALLEEARQFKHPDDIATLQGTLDKLYQDLQIKENEFNLYSSQAAEVTEEISRIREQRKYVERVSLRLELENQSIIQEYNNRVSEVEGTQSRSIFGLPMPTLF